MPPMKNFYLLLLLIGLALTLFGAINWGRAGFPMHLGDLSTMLAGTKPRHLDKDSYFFVVVLGAIIVGYSLLELRIKRWKK